MKRILLVTSAYTGAGHKSISDALTEQFSQMPDVEVKVIDGFELMGSKGIRLSRLYGFLTRRAPAVFNASWRFTNTHPPRFSFSARLCSHSFLEIIDEFHPDLILTVHSLLNVTLTQILKKHNLNLPVVVVQADLVDIHSSWCNPEAFMTICPTREAYDTSVLQGMPPEKLKVFGFPVRRRFCDAAREADTSERPLSNPPHCLLMSGGEGCGSLMDYAESILENTDLTLTIICGRNKKLFSRLQNRVGKQYGNRVTVLGFVSDVEQDMLDSDLLIVRGSPNTLSEAVTMNVPVIMIGPLLEQEKNNPRLMQHYNLGVTCRSPAEAPKVIRSLLKDHGARIREIRASQRAFRSFDSARNITGFIVELIDKLSDTVPIQEQ